MPRDLDIATSALDELRRLLESEPAGASREKELFEKFIEPLFRARGYRAQWMHLRDERRHRLDILLERTVQDGEELAGCQLKARRIAGERDIRDAASGIPGALSFPHRQQHRLTTLYYITSGDLASGFEDDLCQRIKANSGPFALGRYEVWDGRKLIEELAEWAPWTLPRLFLRQRKRRACELSDQGLLGAAGLSNIMSARYILSERLARPSAEEVQTLLRLAIDQLESAHPRYCFKTILKTYAEDLLSLLSSPTARRLLSSDRFVARIDAGEFDGVCKRLRVQPQLLGNVALVLTQLSIIEQRYLEAEGGLTSLRAALLLLRVGWDPKSPAIQKRIDTALQEMQRELADPELASASVDLQCSLCTGVLVSCLSLAGSTEDAEAPLEWLKSKSRARYSYRHMSAGLVSPTKHGRHYAAAVLEAFLDSDETSRAAALRRRLALPGEDGISRFPKDWMRYRNVSSLSAVRPILRSLLHAELMGASLSKAEQNRMRRTLGRLVRLLRKEALDAGLPETDAAANHLARMALGPLALGWTVAAPRARDLAARVGALQCHHLRLLNNLRTSKPRLWDSNFDRTIAFLDGLLLYWEVELRARPLNGDSPH